MKISLISIALGLSCVALAPRPATAQAEFSTTAHAHNQSRVLKASPFDTVFQDVFWDYGDSLACSPTGFSDVPLENLLEESSNLGSHSGLIVRGQSPSSEGEGGGGGSNAGQQAQNPIASLVSLPLQNNWDFGVGPENRTAYVGLLQPVIPFQATENLTWITRPIIPFVNLPIGDSDREHGLAPIQWENVLVPKPCEGSPWMWGAGVDVTFPTASQPVLGDGNWAVGPLFVLVYTEGPIVGGFIATQSFSESSLYQRFFFEPFFNYNFTKGILKEWFIAASGEFQADWEAYSDNRWSNRFGVGPGKNLKLFGQLIQVKTRFAPYLNAPPSGSNWQFQLQVNMLFPK